MNNSLLEQKKVWDYEDIAKYSFWIVFKWKP